jgi:hypothetical protein
MMQERGFIGVLEQWMFFFFPILLYSLAQTRRPDGGQAITPGLQGMRARFCKYFTGCFIYINSLVWTRMTANIFERYEIFGLQHWQITIIVPKTRENRRPLVTIHQDLSI